MLLFLSGTAPCTSPRKPGKRCPGWAKLKSGARPAVTDYWPWLIWFNDPQIAKCALRSRARFHPG
jgi:hypothetical protein